MEARLIQENEVILVSSNKNACSLFSKGIVADMVTYFVKPISYSEIAFTANGIVKNRYGHLDHNHHPVVVTNGQRTHIICGKKFFEVNYSNDDARLYDWKWW